MKKLLSIITIFLVCANGYSQVDYFSEIYNEGALSNIVSIEDTIYQYGAGANNSVKRGLKLSSTGEVLLNKLDTLNGGFWPQFGSSMNVKIDGSGFLHGTQLYTDGNIYGSISSMDLNFNEDWLYLIQPDDIETESISLHVAKELSSGIYGAGALIYDLNEGAGQSFSNLMLIKLDQDGNAIWENEYDWSEITGGEYFLRVSQINELPNEELLISVSRYPNWDQLLLKLDTDGNLLDTYEWGTEFSDGLSFAHIEEDGTTMVAYTKPYEFYENTEYMISRLHLMKFDTETMEPIWDVEFSPSIPKCALHDLIRCSDGGYMLGGYCFTYDVDELPTSDQSGFVLKTNENGEFEWFNYYTQFDDTPEEEEEFEWHEIYDLTNTSDGGVALCGRYWDYEDPAPEAWVFKIDVCGDTQDLGCEQYIHVVSHENLNDPQLSIYPNPSNNIVSIDFPIANFSTFYQLNIYNSNGQKMGDQSSARLQNHQEIDVRNWAAGLYLVQVKDGTGRVVDTKRLIVD